jgi:UDP-N-acetylglucosamine--N-acetylmuramyl-(pentapeptide) pyrophosphoryl-undecaprenol N-acetylglucosamine transferase
MMDRSGDDERPIPSPGPRPESPRAAAAGGVVFAGGGTGGHVFPGLAVAAELAVRGYVVSFIGTASGLEARLVAARGFGFTALPAQPMVGRGPWRRAAALATLGRSAWAARGVVRRAGATVVVGTGGYVSAPGVLGARLAGRKVLLLEPNAHAGAANRWLSRWAHGAALAEPETAVELRCPSWVTGVPVRPEFFAIPAELPSGPGRLLVLGGSQGAQQLNRELPMAVAALRAQFPGLRVLHQAGAKHAQSTREAYRLAGLDASDGVTVVPFIDDVATEMASSQLVVARAGALTLAELRAAGRPALLLPLEIAAGHQVGNARAQERAGAAVVLTSADIAAARLLDTLAGLLGDRERLERMARAARALARPDAAAAIAGHVEALARGSQHRSQPGTGPGTSVGAGA